MAIPSLSELTSGQPQPELAFGSGYGGGVPMDLDLSQTTARLNEISKEAAERKRREKEQFEKRLAEKISTVSKFDGILPQDRKEILEDAKKTRNFIIQNSYLLGAGGADKDSDKYGEMEQMIANFSAKVDKSKADKKFEDDLRMTIRTKPEYNNEETLALLEEWRNKGTDREPFMPIGTGDAELLAKEKEFYSKPQLVKVVTEPVDGDPFSVDKVTMASYDPDQYFNIFKSAKGDFYANKYRRSPELKKEWEEKGGFDAYLKSISEANRKDSKGPIPFGRVRESVDRSELEKKKDERLEKSIASAEKRAALGLAQRDRQFNQRMENAGNKDLDEVINGYDAIQSGLEDKAMKYDLNQLSSLPGMPNSVATLKSVHLLNDAGIRKYNIADLYPGGPSQNGENAYGKLFMIERKDGTKAYAPAKELYLGIKGGQSYAFATKKQFDESFATDKEIKVVPDPDRLYSEDQIIEILMPETLRSKMISVYDQYENFKASRGNTQQTTQRPAAPAPQRKQEAKSKWKNREAK